MNEFLEDKSQNEKYSISREYISNYGYLLPKSFVKMEVKFFTYLYLEKVLNEHPKALDRIRNVTKRETK